jgi:hypothetical protein
MTLYVIKFFADSTPTESSELEYFFADSFYTALKWAKASLPEYRAQHAMASYRIEDATGHAVWIGPGKDDNGDSAIGA